jgi:hypothetical protein
MEGSCSTGQSPQWAVVLVEEEEVNIIIIIIIIIIMELVGSRIFPVFELLYQPPPHIRCTKQSKAFVSKTDYNYKQNV